MRVSAYGNEDPPTPKGRDGAREDQLRIMSIESRQEKGKPTFSSAPAREQRERPFVLLQTEQAHRHVSSIGHQRLSANPPPAPTQAPKPDTETETSTKAGAGQGTTPTHSPSPSRTAPHHHQNPRPAKPSTDCQNPRPDPPTKSATCPLTESANGNSVGSARRKRPTEVMQDREDEQALG